jgi:hypothetical protein
VPDTEPSGYLFSLAETEGQPGSPPIRRADAARRRDHRKDRRRLGRTAARLNDHAEDLATRLATIPAALRVTIGAQIATIRSSPPVIADTLRRQADNFIELEELKDVIGRPPRPAGGNSGE